MTGLSSIFQYRNSLIESRMSINAFHGVEQDLCYFLRNFLRKFFFFPRLNGGKANGIIIQALIQESAHKVNDVLRQLHPNSFELQR